MCKEERGGGDVLGRGRGTGIRLTLHGYPHIVSHGHYKLVLCLLYREPGGDASFRVGLDL